MARDGDWAGLATGVSQWSSVTCPEIRVGGVKERGGRWVVRRSARSREAPVVEVRGGAKTGTTPASFPIFRGGWGRWAAAGRMWGGKAARVASHGRWVREVGGGEGEKEVLELTGHGGEGAVVRKTMGRATRRALTSSKLKTSVISTILFQSNGIASL